MSTHPTSPGRADAALCEARADVKAEIARTDTKASLLVAFTGALVAGLTAAVPSLHLTAPVSAVGGAGVVLLLVAAGLLLSVIRPRLRPAAPGSFPHLAGLDAEEIRSELSTDRRAENISVLSRLAVAKFGRLQRAVDCIRAGGLLIALAAVLAWVGGAV